MTLIDPSGLDVTCVTYTNTWDGVHDGVPTKDVRAEVECYYEPGSYDDADNEGGGASAAPTAPKSPTKQQCEANANNNYNDNLPNVLLNSRMGAVVGVIAVPVGACLVGGILASEDGPAEIAMGCGIGLAITFNPVTFAVSAGAGATVGLVASDGQWGNAKWKYHQQMAACALIP